MKSIYFRNYVKSDFWLFLLVAVSTSVSTWGTAGDKHLKRKLLNKFNNRINKSN